MIQKLKKNVIAITIALLVTGAVQAEDRSDSTVTHEDVKVINYSPLNIGSTAIELELGKTTELTVYGGKAAYTVRSSDDSIATATLGIENKLTITGVAEGSAEIIIKDTNSNKVKVFVTVKTNTVTILPLLGNDGIDKYGNPLKSYAKFYGGVSTDGGTTYERYKEISEDQSITLRLMIEYDPAHVSKKGNLYVTHGYPKPDDRNFLLWKFYERDGSSVDWEPIDFGTRVPYDERDALGELMEILLYEDMIIKDKGQHYLFIAYETTDDSTIYFNAEPIVFKIN